MHAGRHTWRQEGRQVSGKKHDYKECTQLQLLEWLDCGNATECLLWLLLQGLGGAKTQGKA